MPPLVDLYNEGYAWTPSDHPSNDYGVGYFTPLRRSDGALMRACFDEEAEHELFNRWDGSDAAQQVPRGSLIRYACLYPVLLCDYSLTTPTAETTARSSSKKKNRGEVYGDKNKDENHIAVGSFVRYEDLCRPVDDTRLLVYNGCYNSRRDPRSLTTTSSPSSSDNTALTDLFRGCQSKFASCQTLHPRRRDFDFRIVAYVERLNKQGGAMVATYPSGAHPEVVKLRKLGRNNFTWYARLCLEVDRKRSVDFPYAQPACVLWYRQPMGRVLLCSRKLCRDMQNDLEREEDDK